MAITDSGVGLGFDGDFFDHVLRNHYLPEVADALNHDYFLLERFGRLKDKSMVQGKFVQHPIHNGRNASGVGAVGIRGKLPTPTQQGYTEYQYPIRSLYGRILFTGLVTDASKTDIDSWLRAVDSEMTGIRDDLARQENRICQGNGSGIISQTPTADGAASATQTMRFPPNLEGRATMDETAMDTTHFFEVDMRIAVINATTEVILDVVTVVSKTATTVTFNTSVTTTGGDDFFYVTGNDDALTSTQLEGTGYQREPMGISGIVSDSDTGAYHESSITGFQNVASTEDFNQAIVLDNSSVRRPLTEALVQKMVSEVEKKLKGNPTLMVGSYGIRDAFADLLLTYRRHVNRMELRSGFNTVSYNEVPLVPDRDAYPNRLQFLDESDIRQHVLGSADYRFIDEDGSIYHRLQDEHAFQSTLYRRWTFGAMARGRHGTIVDLDE